MKLLSVRFRAMGGPCEIRFYGADESAVTPAQYEIARLEKRYSRFLDSSIVSRINASAGDGRGVRVDDETAALLDYASAAHVQSDGLFDLTSGVLRRAWDFRSGRVPAQEEIAPLLPLIGWEKIFWQRPNLLLPRAGMQLDFGGMVKEYAADRAAQALRAAGVAHGLIELGGDIAIIGPHPDGSPWRVGIRHPRLAGSAIAYVELASGGIASSGDYERFVEADGQRYCHILNPRTGWPVQHLASVSVVAPQCLIAGTSSTVAMLKEREGQGWLAELGLPHLCFDRQLHPAGTLAFLTG
ncbi:MAG: FAD:protein FMN transferase [Pseudomonadota bacterium]